MLYWSQRGCRQQQCNNETVKSVEFNLIADHFIKMAGQSYHNNAISGISDTTLPKKKNRWTNLLLFFWRSSTPLYFCIRMDFLHKFERNEIQKWHSMKPQAREKYFNLSYTFNYFNIFQPVLNNQPERKDHWLPLLKNAWHYCSYLALDHWLPLKRGLLPRKESILQGTNISPSNGSQRASMACCRE